MTIARTNLFRTVLIMTIVVGFFGVITAAPAYAQEEKKSSLVSCGLGRDNPDPCTICDLVKLFKDIIDFVTFRLTLILGTVMIIVAGFTIMLGGANPEMIKTGRGMLTKTLTGVAIIFGSWFIANFILISLAGDHNEAKKWYQLECTDPVEPALPQPSPGTTGGSVNAEDLTAIISCVGSKVSGSKLGSIATFDSIAECNAV